MEEHPGPPFNLDESDVSEEKNNTIVSHQRVKGAVSGELRASKNQNHCRKSGEEGSYHNERSYHGHVFPYFYIARILGDARRSLANTRILDITEMGIFELPGGEPNRC